MNARVIQLVSLLAAAGFLFAATRFSAPINVGRANFDMMGADSIEQGTPPEYAFAIQAFGAFRGILTNIAFIRAETYKEQGRYYDAMQLAAWICKLQPRFPTVWEFQSWNMAWNISVTTYTPEERWNWVYNGARLIRDEGLRYNPRAINLYKQLAWIFVNKMSETADQFHQFYKRNWAWRMHLVLGSPPDPLGRYRPDESFDPVEIEIGQDRLGQATLKEAERRVERLRQKVEERGKPWDISAYEAAVAFVERIKRGAEAGDPDGDGELTADEVAKQAAYDRIKSIADAPDTLDELYGEFPDARRMVADLRAFGVNINDDVIREDQYMKEGVGLGEAFFFRYRMLTEPPALLAALLRNPEPDPDTPKRERLAEILGLAPRSEAGFALVRFLEKKVLRDVYKLRADRMADLMATFGPIDWRVVDAHSVYWVNEGLIATEDSIRNIRNDKTNTARLIFFSLRNLMQRNRITFEPYTTNINYAYINFNPDWNFIESMHQAYLTYGAMLDPEPELKGAGVTYRSGHINFLAEAVRMLYFADRVPEAAHYFEYLRETYGVKNGELEARYAKPLRDYVFDTLAEDGGSLNEKRSQIYGYLTQAWFNLSQGNRAQANMLRQAAQVVWEKYNEEVGEEEITKLALPPFREIQLDTLLSWYRQPAISQVSLVDKARLWNQLSPDFKLPLYDQLFEQLIQECDLYQFTLAKVAPPPAGLEQWREENAGRAEQVPEKAVETPAQND
jgi:hypothetical protein